MVRGIFITVEGPDGAGKTSLIKELTPIFQRHLAIPFIVTREPGGIPIAEKIRQIILDPANGAMDDRTEALLYAAARRQHLMQKVIPAVESGQLVLCDRFVDSSLAYQGAGRGIGMEEVAQLNDFAINGFMPDLTLYLDVDSDTGLQRIRQGRQNEQMDRLETESIQFHQKVRHAYLKLVKEFPERIVTINAKNSLMDVVSDCLTVLEERYPEIFQ